MDFVIEIERPEAVLLFDIDVDPVDPLSMLSEIEDQEKAERRLERIANCGSVRSRWDHVSDGYKHFSMSCKYWRECPRCAKQRGQDFTLRYYRALADTDDQVGAVWVQKSKKAIRELRENGVDYWSLPQEDGTVILWDRTDYEIEGDAVELDWEVLCRTPEGRKTSGKLGEEPKEVDDSPKIVFPIHQFSVEMPDGKSVIEAGMIAAAKTDDMVANFDEDSLRYLAWCKGECFKETVEEMGGVITAEETVWVGLSLKVYSTVPYRSKVTESERDRVAVEVEKPPLVPIETLLEQLDLSF